jgi:hypothetical protein
VYPEQLNKYNYKVAALSKNTLKNKVKIPLIARCKFLIFKPLNGGGVICSTITELVFCRCQSSSVLLIQLK